MKAVIPQGCLWCVRSRWGFPHIAWQRRIDCHTLATSLLLLMCKYICTVMHQQPTYVSLGNIMALLFDSKDLPSTSCPTDQGWKTWLWPEGRMRGRQAQWGCSATWAKRLLTIFFLFIIITGHLNIEESIWTWDSFTRPFKPLWTKWSSIDLQFPWKIS